MRTILIVIGILCLTFIGLNQRSSAETQLSDLSWIAGHWSGVQDGVEMEESWLEPKGNTMLGLHRDVKAGRTISFEFLRISANADGITYWASPGGKPPTPFKLKEVTGKKVVFENAEHDFPQRIIYWLEGNDSLHAKIEGNLKGQPASEEWSWRRAGK
ncbi:MAG TPA: DUF6265 family protein [Pyrinomonadaceae bacterium]|nr:DUF6265 family protein [Pyrinomonadaceae bacterium]